MAVLFCSLSGFTQQNNLLWTKITKSQASEGELVKRKVDPFKADFYQLDLEQLRASLELAPNRKTFQGESPLVIQFPNADGNFESFRVKEAPLMEESLQIQFPNIRSYVGQSIDNPIHVIRFSITPNGLNTMTFTETGTHFLDPYTTNENYYISYSKSDLGNDPETWVCDYVDDIEENSDRELSTNSNRNANDSTLREFRLALACTVEYAQFHGGTLEGVMAAMTNTMTRVNGVYERELSITMIMVDNTNIIYLGPNVFSDPYTNDDGGAMLAQNQSTVNAQIGIANYDIGHVFSTGGGGIASLNSPCTGFKAQGVTGLPSPTGDAFDVDYVCHEMGHQYGAPHTFNGNAPGTSCLTQRTASNAYEPGSGSTIMAYAGICPPQNVQNGSDDYFHQKSLDVIFDNITIGNSQCANLIPVANDAPTADAGGNFIIPASTPYKLTGSGTDDGGPESLTYTWEQYDLGPTGAPTETTVQGPIVRSFKGTNDPVRIIPRLSDLLVSNGSTDWEKLSSVNRALNFRLTVRDNDPDGGQTAVDAMLATVNASAGPFIVTSQETDQVVWTPGTTETITWNVAGTNGNGINAASVNILLSTSDTPGVEGFDTVLASNVANDGSYDITVPNITSPYCRIMVEASDNIFFNINDNYFAIGNYTYGPGDICEDYFFEANLLLDENDMTFQGFLLPINDSRTISDVNVSVDITTTNNAELAMGIRGPFGGDITFLQSGTNNGCPGLPDALVTFDDEGMVNACNSTNTNLSIQPLQPLSFADGQDSQGDWIFNVGDIIVDGNRATWNSITITICETGIIPVLSTNEIDLESSLSVYPNPNNGEFNIKFNANSNDVDVQVFDVRGRSVYSKSFENGPGEFNQTINLGSVHTGVYLLNINDGDNTVTKKIVVE